MMHGGGVKPPTEKFERVGAGCAWVLVTIGMVIPWFIGTIKIGEFVWNRLR